MQDDILDQNFRRSSAQDDAEISRLTAENLESYRSIAYARNLLFILAGLVVLFTIFQFNIIPEGDDITFRSVLIEAVFLFVAYLGSAIFSFRNPRIALILGLSVFLLYHTLLILVGGVEIYNGIILKIIVIGTLGKGIQGAFRIHKNNKRIIFLGGDILKR